jgi:1-acyl-sn-glycerol-3-phosphate acyltransferase
VETPRFPRTWRQRAVIAPLARALRLWYRPRLHGIEAVPRDRPVVYVAKHPRSWLYLEVILLGLETFWDGGRPAFRPMEARRTSLHRIPGLAWLRRNVGAIPATEAAALAVLRGGESVLVFPGGARELYGAPDAIDWRGRRGFARIASLAGAPVVPVAIGGADRQHPLRVPLGARASLWLPPVPLPIPLDFVFGAALAPPSDGDAAAIAALAARAEAETRALLARAAAGARSAWSLA